MGVKVYRRVINDTSQSTGTGALVMDGTTDSSLAQGNGWLGGFAADQDITFLCILDGAGNYEVGQYQVSISGKTVTINRYLIISSSNNGLAVNFGAGGLTITNRIPQVVQEVLLGINQFANIEAELDDIRDLLSQLVG